MHIIYNLAIQLYHVGIRIAALSSSKAKQWVEGRKNWEAQLVAFNSAHSDQVHQDRIWVHCASLGEFEQGRTLIERIKQQFPTKLILLTFYSPSGYEIRKNYEPADGIFYLPLDTKRNAKRFIQLAQPSVAVFVKYEFWYHFLSQLHLAQIPTYLISAVFRPDHIFFKPYGGFFRKLLGYFDHIFVQDQSSLKLLEKVDLSAISIAGDTRVDRVAQIPKEGKHFPLIDSFVDSAPCLIAGSTWPADEQFLQKAIEEALDINWKVIIAPHDIADAHLKAIEQQFPSQLIRYSQLSDPVESSFRYLLIDNIGMLQVLYRYGKIAYIGGGFGSGIHNTLEPITFGLPVIFGPKYQKFEEAKQLIQSGGGFTVANEAELIQTLQLLLEEDSYLTASQRAKAYITDNQGGTDKIIAHLFK